MEYLEFNPFLKLSLWRMLLNFLRRFNEVSMLVITSKFLSIYCWSSVSTEETSTLKLTKSLSKVLLAESRSLWFFFLSKLTNF
jgi:hypothetical protein